MNLFNSWKLKAPALSRVTSEMHRLTKQYKLAQGVKTMFFFFPSLRLCFFMQIACPCFIPYVRCIFHGMADPDRNCNPPPQHAREKPTYQEICVRLCLVHFFFFFPCCQKTIAISDLNTSKKRNKVKLARKTK